MKAWLWHTSLRAGAVELKSDHTLYGCCYINCPASIRLYSSNYHTCSVGISPSPGCINLFTVLKTSKFLLITKDGSTVMNGGLFE